VHVASLINAHNRHIVRKGNVYKGKGIKIIAQKMVKTITSVDRLLKKLNNHPVDNDSEFLNCLIDLDDRIKRLETKKEIYLKSKNHKGGIENGSENNKKEIINSKTGKDLCRT